MQPCGRGWDRIGWYGLVWFGLVRDSAPWDGVAEVEKSLAKS